MSLKLLFDHGEDGFLLPGMTGDNEQGQASGILPNKTPQQRFNKI
jgi:hypothetical protein